MNDHDARACRTCAFFDGDAHSLEQRIPGLRTLSSAHASVRDEDGLCSHHDRLVSARSSCAEFAPKPAAG